MTPPSTSSPAGEPTREELLEIVRTFFVEADPVPAGLVARMQAAAILAAAESGPGLDAELMTLVEQSKELAGTRSAGLATAYTLRFVLGDTDLLLRISPTDGDDGRHRIDGWIVPAGPTTVRALSGEAPGRLSGAVVAEAGRFELDGLAAGPTRLRLEPHESGRPAFLTPYFDL